ncbi:MAG: hypothetical protein SPF57_00815 [Streptococcus orisratti]|uniref:hypothetical protein n=1 Tax=Streptococcus orisratti TaxID=114652 RepID=UPI002A912EF4|nr:hypothetical protein [Streptococcus orisratti]MDY5634898.1 hypothetical protein [Streptococcus orisratti]
MKKKLFAVLLMVMSVFLLVACSSKDDLDGEYYWVRDADYLQTMVTIKGNSGTIDVDGTYSITNIDTDKKQITVNAGSDYILPYSYNEDGSLTIVEDSLYGSSAKVTYYKKGSKALKEEVKKAKEEEAKKKNNN